MSKKKNQNEADMENLIEYFQKELSSRNENKVENFISTGSTLLDYAIANRKSGGIPVGRITEICGNEGTGKSLVAYHILANTQKSGGIGVYIDTERAANQEFMERMGISWKKLIKPYPIPSSIEEIFEYIEKVAITTRTKFPNKEVPVVVVWDSVAASVGKEEIETAHTERPAMGLEARAMSRSLRKLMEILDSGYVTLVCTNQLREKMGVSFGDSETTAHGKALPFYCSVRIKLKFMKQIKDVQAGRTIGNATEARVFKNKVASNWRTVNFPIYYDWGVHDEISWLDYMCELDVVKTTGAWRTISVNGNDYKFQGTSGWMDVLKKDGVKDFVLKKIDENMVYVYNRRPDSIAIDVDSILEVDSLKGELTRQAI